MKSIRRCWSDRLSQRGALRHGLAAHHHLDRVLYQQEILYHYWDPGTQAALNLLSANGNRESGHRR